MGSLASWQLKMSDQLSLMTFSMHKSANRLSLKKKKRVIVSKESSFKELSDGMHFIYETMLQEISE